MLTRTAGLILLLLQTNDVHCQPFIAVLSGTAHLRSGEAREWRSFPNHASGKRLSIAFDMAASNKGEYALMLRQRDVKNRNWAVKLNRTALGSLLEDERRMICVLPVPAGLLRAGQNTFEIAAGSGDVSASDDIEVSDVAIHAQPVASMLRQTTVTVAVRDPIPARITVVDRLGWLVPIVSLRDKDVVRTGVVYTPDGESRIGLPAGEYRIYASRGFEYNAPSANLRIAARESRRIVLDLKRETSVPGYVSVDTHVHTRELSGHGDASVDERVVTAAAEGLNYVVATEHNQSADYTDAIARRELSRWLRSIPGNEVTTGMGHFNVFPAAGAVAEWRAKDWAALRKSLRNTVVIQNHPRDAHAGYRPFDPRHHLSAVGENLQDRPVFANAMEVVNSGAMASDPLQLVRDWLGLLTRGLRIAGVGASDTHTVDFVPIGQARTYVEGSDVAQGIAAGKTLVSYGLLAMLHQKQTAKNGRAAMEVQIMAPSWSGADAITLYSNGLPAWQRKLKLASRFRDVIDVPVPKHDTVLVAVATGPGVMQPFWEVRKPYQPTSDVWSPVVLGVSAAVRIDVDGDGVWTAPMAYAEMALKDNRSFEDYDDSVVRHALNLLRLRGADMQSEEIRKRFGRRFLLAFD